MTGPEHYREAESYLADAATADQGSPGENYLLAAAQVHATLALVAVHSADAVMRNEDRAEWDAATGYTSNAEVTR